jgi:Protein of unknown function (DUF2934)
MAKPRTPRKKSNGSETLPTNAIMTETSPENGLETATAAAPAEPGNTEMKSTLKKSTRKPEIVKTESRSNLVPINLEDEIRRLAYLMSERRGFAPGHETDDWLAAEHEVLERYQHQTVQTA